MIGFVTRNLRHYPRALKENAYMSYVRLLTLLVRSDRHLSVGPSTIRHVKSWRIKLLDWGCLQLFYHTQVKDVYNTILPLYGTIHILDLLQGCVYRGKRRTPTQGRVGV